MADINRIQRPPGQPAPPAVDGKGNGTARETRQTSNGAPSASFADLLRARQGVVPASSGATAADPSAAPALRFSAHAQTRLQSRRIALQPGQLDRLHGAVQRAAGKGSRDALVLMDDLALVVSVANRTVVTVVDKDNLKQNVFTNIDSAVIA